MQHQKIAAAITTIVIATSVSSQTNKIPNRLIDYPAFQQQVKLVGQWRETHRVTEDQFIEMAKRPDTVVLDARSHEKYQMLHITGAKHLSLPDFTAAELTKIIPNKSTPVLIYCNNNFLNSPRALPSKAPSASLNIYTINSLASYGYTNVYELGPLLDIRSTKLMLAGSELKTRE
jgi:hypothetical protein